MLLQSHTGTIHILPALPPSWTKGRIAGLKARGGILVSIEWEGEAVRVELCSAKDHLVKVKVKRGAQREVFLPAGKKIVISDVA